MRPHRSSPSTGAGRPAFLRRVDTLVLVGATLAAVVAGSVGLVWANSRSSSSCEIESGTHSGATTDSAPAEGVDCDATGVIVGSAVPAAPTDSETTSSSHEPGHAMSDHAASDHADSDHAMPGDVVVVATEPGSTDPDSAAPAPGDSPVDSAPANTTTGESAPADSESATTTSTATDPDPAPTTQAPSTSSAPANPDSTPATQAPTTSSAPANPDSTSATPAPTSPSPVAANYSDITTFGVFHGTSSHTHHDSLAGGRTAITTEALVVYNGLRAFHGLEVVQPEAIGRWAFANSLTNNSQAYGQELTGVGLYYGMQGAKVGWIRDDAFDPQILADIQRTAREGGTGAVMTMVETYGHPGYADYLTRSGLVDAFVNTLKMEPHYGGWMHGRVHGGLPFSNGAGATVATAHDLNHLTVLSHDQRQPFMNDTFDWPQWPALDVPESTVIDYFQSMVVLRDPHSDALP